MVLVSIATHIVPPQLRSITVLFRHSSVRGTCFARWTRSSFEHGSALPFMRRFRFVSSNGTFVALGASTNHACSNVIHGCGATPRCRYAHRTGLPLSLYCCVLLLFLTGWLIRSRERVAFTTRFFTVGALLRAFSSSLWCCLAFTAPWVLDVLV
jgi:uncharacterized membrane protein YgdD (TMEM256/DUF423 family)